MRSNLCISQFTESFDYEKEIFYKIYVDVTDGVATATVTIAISVTDVNEGPPEFTSSGKN